MWHNISPRCFNHYKYDAKTFPAALNDSVYLKTHNKTCYPVFTPFQILNKRNGIVCWFIFIEIYSSVSDWNPSALDLIITWYLTSPKIFIESVMMQCWGHWRINMLNDECWIAHIKCSTSRSAFFACDVPTKSIAYMQMMNIFVKLFSYFSVWRS